MKILFAFVVMAAGGALARPQFQGSDTDYYSNPEDVNAIVTKQEYDEGPDFGQFRYNFETSNGLYEERDGYLLPEGGQFKRGIFHVPLPNGEVAIFTYTADYNGYQVQSDYLPVGPPMPAHALEQIRRAEELRAQGVQWDIHGFRIN